MATQNERDKMEARKPGMPPARVAKDSGQKASVGDLFVDYSRKMVDWVYLYRTPVMAVFIGIFVVAGGSSLYNRYHSNKNLEAADAITRAEEKLPDDMSRLAQLGIDLGQLGMSGEKGERDAKYLEVAGELSKAADTYQKYPAGIQARLREANYLAKAGKDDEAIAAYKKVLELKPKQEFEYAALSGMGHLLLKKKSYPEAMAAFKQISEEGKGLWQQLGTIDMASTQEAQGDFKAALSTYDAFLTKHADSGLLEDVQKRQKLAKAVVEGKIDLNAKPKAPEPEPVPSLPSPGEVHEGAVPPASDPSAPVVPVAPQGEPQ